MGRHQLKQEMNRVRQILRDAGFVLIIIMGLVLIILAVGIAFAVGGRLL